MAEAQRRKVLDTGFGTNFLSTLSGGISDRLAKRQQAEAELRQVLAKATLEAELKQRFDPEAQAKQRILGLATEAGKVPQPMGGYNREEMAAGAPAAVQEAAQGRELDFLKYILPRSTATASELLAPVVFDPNSRRYLDPEGNEVKSVKRGTPVRNAPLSTDILYDQSRARALGTNDPLVAERKGAAKATEQAFTSSEKLGQAVRRLSLLNRQFQEALPTGDRSPAEQRIAGRLSVFGAKTGLQPNPKLLALKSNIRPIAINLIRLFGEVGNLSESEQQGAIDVVTQENLTDDERIAKIRQFAEFALAGAPPQALAYLQQQPDIQDIITQFGIQLGSNATETQPTAESLTPGAMFQGQRIKSVRRKQ